MASSPSSPSTAGSKSTSPSLLEIVSEKKSRSMSKLTTAIEGAKEQTACSNKAKERNIPGYQLLTEQITFLANIQQPGAGAANPTQSALRAPDSLRSVWSKSAHDKAIESSASAPDRQPGETRHVPLHQQQTEQITFIANMHQPGSGASNPSQKVQKLIQPLPCSGDSMKEVPAGQQTNATSLFFTSTKSRPHPTLRSSSPTAAALRREDLRHLREELSKVHAVDTSTTSGNDSRRSNRSIPSSSATALVYSVAGKLKEYVAMQQQEDLFDNWGTRPVTAQERCDPKKLVEYLEKSMAQSFSRTTKESSFRNSKIRTEALIASILLGKGQGHESLHQLSSSSTADRRQQPAELRTRRLSDIEQNTVGYDNVNRSTSLKQNLRTETDTRPSTAPAQTRQSNGPWPRQRYLHDTGDEGGVANLTSENRPAFDRDTLLRPAHPTASSMLHRRNKGTHKRSPKIVHDPIYGRSVKFASPASRPTISGAPLVQGAATELERLRRNAEDQLFHRSLQSRMSSQVGGIG